MATDIGSKGLAEVNLVIPQSTSLTFEIIHKDDEGNIVDHSQSTARMAIQSKNGSATVNLSNYCSCTDSGVEVSLPASVTSALSVGKMVWDMIVDTQAGESLRLAYGTVIVVDTYAKDE